MQRLMDSGDVYLVTFEGWYDAGQEEYYTETKARDVEYTYLQAAGASDEENYYFKLVLPIRIDWSRCSRIIPTSSVPTLGGTKYSDVCVRDCRMCPSVEPTSSGHRGSRSGRTCDLCLDRRVVQLHHRFGLADADSEWYAQRHGYWPASMQVIGMRSQWFHAVIWPALLMALELLSAPMRVRPFILDQ